MKNIKIKDKEKDIIEDVGECINISEIEYLYTDYFDDYDYICGDYSYDKLRLKGFNEKTNKNFNKVNDIATYDKYIEDLCSYKAKHFLLKKLNK